MRELYVFEQTPHVARLLPSEFTVYLGLRAEDGWLATTVVRRNLIKVRTRTFANESLVYYFRSVVVTLFKERLNGPVILIVVTVKLG